MSSIALLHNAAPPVVGGVEGVIGHHARLMTDNGHRVCIVAGRGGEPGGQIEFAHVPLADSRHPDVLAAKTQLDLGAVPDEFDQLVSRTLGQLEPALQGIDIVIAHNVCSLHKNLALTAALHTHCARPQAPKLISWHHDLAWTTPRYARELHAGWPWDLIRQDWPEVRPQHVAVSELRRAELANLFKLDPASIAVVPSGLDAATFLGLSELTREIVQKLNLLAADPLLLLPVRITRRKNIELAIRVLAQLRASMPAARLIVTGPLGPHNPSNQQYFDTLRALRAELGLAGAVHFLAEVVDSRLSDEVIAELYRLADALVLPSREEGFGIPVLEAGMAKLPVFCSDIPPLRAIAGDAARYFSSDGPPSKIAAQIDSELRRRSTYTLRHRVQGEYAWQAVYAHRIAPLLDEVIRT